MTKDENKSAVLINPPSAFLINDQVMPPLGIMYISSWLKYNAIESNIIDLTNEIILENFINGHIPSATHYFITATTPQYTSAVKCMNTIRSVNPNAIIIIGGPHATFRSNECHDDGFDYVIIGEGEDAALRIMQHDLTRDNRMSGIIIGKSSLDLNYTPFPDREFDGFDEYDYTVDGKKATTMFTTRGCPFHCAFCAKMFDGVRTRDADSVLSEVAMLKSKGFGSIMFFDDTFTFNKKRLKLICKGMKQLKMSWRCFIHAHTVDEQMLQMMKKGGCVEVGMGVESGNSGILRTINKRTDLNEIEKVVKCCHEIGIRVKTFLIAGLPGESFNTMMDTQAFLLKIKPDDFDLTMFVPYPGNDIWNNPDNYDITFDKENYDFEDMFYKGRDGEYVPMISTSSLTREQISVLRHEIVDNVRSKLNMERQ